MGACAKLHPRIAAQQEDRAMAFANWAKLMSNVALHAGPVMIVGALIDAVAEQTSTETNAALGRIENDLLRLMAEPLLTARGLLEDSKQATGSYRIHCLEQARLHFKKAVNLQPQDIKIEQLAGHIDIVQAIGYQGVCAELLRQDPLALSDYEGSFRKALSVEGAIWYYSSPSEAMRYLDQTNPGVYHFGTQNCSVSRRALFAAIAEIIKSHDQYISVHTDLYKAMAPLVPLLARRGSKVISGHKVEDLRVDNLDRAAKFIGSFRNSYCPGDSPWMKAEAQPL
jgi:hypothetical protein